PPAYPFFLPIHNVKEHKSQAKPPGNSPTQNASQPAGQLRLASGGHLLSPTPQPVKHFFEGGVKKFPPPAAARRGPSGQSGFVIPGKVL
ncbi:hypothetical protein, partial [Oleispirillum naphthae]|uniref:hypothetical protein n=1 Tax=Oleispirillum naphthae TaxID=2838853 RepID=UPI00308228DC